MLQKATKAYKTIIKVIKLLKGSFLKAVRAAEKFNSAKEFLSAKDF